MNNASFFENLAEVLKLKSMTETLQKVQLRKSLKRSNQYIFGEKRNSEVLLRLNAIFKSGKCQIYSWFSQICAY